MNNLTAYNTERSAFWDKIYSTDGNSNLFSSAYHFRVKEVVSFIIPESSSVLELGCGDGSLIGSLNASKKTGVDFSQAAISKAKEFYPDTEFILADVHSLTNNENTDYIILSDLINDVYDVQILFQNLVKNCHENTKLIINFYSKLWSFPLKFAEKIKLKKKNLEQNWLTVHDVINLLKLSGFEFINHKREVLFPVRIPLLYSFFNKFLSRFFPFNHLCLTNFVTAGLIPSEIKSNSVSIIVPARNEAGNIRDILDGVEKLGSETELIFVEGNSSDNTYDVIKSEIKNYTKLPVSLYKQKGKGKGDAVREGFKHANGDILMILDADLTVPPDRLKFFYEAIVTGKGEFINGVRLVYPMDKKAMRFFNLLGNKFFSWAFTWLIGQPVKDTLCGTKVLYKKDYNLISENREYFGNFDPYGDFDLIFGAAKINLKIIDLPVRYRERTYGETNISRWSGGWLLLKMVFFAARKLKFK